MGFKAKLNLEDSICMFGPNVSVQTSLILQHFIQLIQVMVYVYTQWPWLYKPMSTLSSDSYGYISQCQHNQVNRMVT